MFYEIEANQSLLASAMNLRRMVMGGVKARTQTDFNNLAEKSGFRVKVLKY